MILIKTCVVVCVLLSLIDFHQCARYGGGSRRGGGAPPRGTTRRPYTTSRPYSSTYRSQSSTYRPQSSTYRAQSSTYRSNNYGSSTRRPYQSSTTPRNPYESTKRYDPVGSGNNNNAGWNVPPRPGSNPPPYSGPQNIKIVNKYNYNYPGHYSIPVQSQGHPGYFYSPSSYSYGSHDTGSTALGFFLGYSLAKITTPTYSHYSMYDGYRPRYDHYEVHHYYHNKDSVPQKQEIQSNSIVGCVGDSTTICPAGTTSLCTSNGALMCVVSATSTVPCTDNRQVNCVKSTIACVNNTAPECKNSNSTTISIPCISNAEVHGELKYVNNTIVAVNGTENGTVSTTPSSSTQYPITTTPSSTQYPITTTPSSVVVAPIRSKREVPQNFCVTIVALPAKKKETEGEVVFKDAKYIFENFVESVYDL